jgi:transcriptional regulator of acetoin/glycerol metabolism
MTPKKIEMDFIFLRSQAQRFMRLIDALESSPLLISAVNPQPLEIYAQETEKIRPLADIEREAILNAHETYGDDYQKACVALGIGKTTYYRKLKQYGVRV